MNPTDQAITIIRATTRAAHVAADCGELAAAAAAESDWIACDYALEQACVIEGESDGDAPIWSQCREAVQAIAIEAIDAQWTAAAIAGLRIVARGRVAIVDDGGDQWMAYRADLGTADSRCFEAAARRARILADDSAKPYQELCDHCGGVLISRNGASCGSRRDQAILLHAAVRDRLIDRSDAAQWWDSVSTTIPSTKADHAS